MANSCGVAFASSEASTSLSPLDGQRFCYVTELGPAPTYIASTRTVLEQSFLLCEHSFRAFAAAAAADSQCSRSCVAANLFQPR